ncbi:MAG: putative holin [Arsenophonus sp. NC-PY1-MAG3]
MLTTVGLLLVISLVLPKQLPVVLYNLALINLTDIGG